MKMSNEFNPEQSLPVGTQLNLANTTPSEDPQLVHERAMFNKHVQDQGQQIPSNFKTPDDWFNSLVEARKGYTQARQEVAALKKQYNENGMNNPGFSQDPSLAAQAPPQPIEDLSGIAESLSIAAPVAPIPGAQKVGSEDWVRWGKEIDSTGSVSDATRKEIQAKMGADAVVVEQMIKGRQALAKQSWEQAAQVVGGGDNLKRLFKWAQDTLPVDEVAATNRALQTNAYISVLQGLKARYDQLQPKPKGRPMEPQPTPNRVNPSAVPQAVQVFKTQREQHAALGDPRFRTDPNFRRAVEQMVVNSSRYGFQSK